MGWVALVAVTIGLLVAGVYKKNHKNCTGIEVVFDGDGNNFFIDEKGVAEILKANGVETGVEEINEAKRGSEEVEATSNDSCR